MADQGPIQPQPRYISQAQKCISTFISHNAVDNGEARYFEDTLQQAGFSAFQYGHGLDPSRHITETVKAQIENCHFFLFIVSDYSMQSEWVQRELGLALRQREKNGGVKPVIIPVFAREAVWRRSNKRPIAFPVLDFETGGPREPFNLGEVRCLDRHANPDIDSPEVLISMMRPRIMVSRVDLADATDVEKTQARSLYENMFPENERDLFDDIMEWSFQSDLGRKREVVISGGSRLSYQLDSRFVVLSVANRAIGFGFFTYDYASSLIYGNYIAVQECWRAGDVASYFLDEITRIMDELFPANQGTVFEVERFDKSRIEGIIAHVAQHKDFQSADDRREIQKFLRVTWYQARSCRFFVDEDAGEPLACRAPCLDPDQTDWAGQEADYWLMWRPKPNSVIDLSNASGLWEKTLNCIYIEVLMKSLVETYTERGPRYMQYATGLTDRNLKVAGSKKIIFGRYLHRRDSPLLRQWLGLGIPVSV